MSASGLDIIDRQRRPPVMKRHRRLIGNIAFDTSAVMGSGARPARQ